MHNGRSPTVESLARRRWRKRAPLTDRCDGGDSNSVAGRRKARVAPTGDHRDARIGLTLALARPAGPYELDRRLEQRKILLVVGCIDPVDLYPFPRACHPAGLKRDDVVPREQELRRGGNGQSQSNPFAANAGKHHVGDEIGVEAADRSSR